MPYNIIQHYLSSEIDTEFCSWGLPPEIQTEKFYALDFLNLARLVIVGGWGRRLDFVSQRKNIGGGVGGCRNLHFWIKI